MEWNDTALVLHVGRFKESDMWVRLLFEHHGLVTAFAFGGSRSRRRFCGCLDVLNTVTCRVKTTRQGQYMALEEGVLKKGPDVLRTQWDRLGMAMNCVKFLEVFGVAREGAKASFSLMQNILDVFEKPKLAHNLYPLLFRLRMASEQGFAPDFAVCALCGSSLQAQGGVFHMDEGNTHCISCAQRHGKEFAYAYTLSLAAKSLEFLRKVQFNPPNTWDVLDLHFKERQDCCRAIDGFVQFHLGIAFDEGRFKKI